MQEIHIDLPVCNQFDDAHEKEWAHRICAICSLWILLKLHDPKFSRSVMDLVHEAVARDGYLENIGWKHAALVALAGEYGLTLHHAAKFFYTREEKESGLAIINKNLENRHPVIVSVFHELNPAKAGHMVVINGLQKFRNKTIGYYIQDSDPRFRGHNYFLTREEFLNGWRGGLVYQD